MKDPREIKRIKIPHPSPTSMLPIGLVFIPIHSSIHIKYYLLESPGFRVSNVQFLHICPQLPETKDPNHVQKFPHSPFSPSPP